MDRQRIVAGVARRGADVVFPGVSVPEDQGNARPPAERDERVEFVRIHRPSRGWVVVQQVRRVRNEKVERQAPRLDDRPHDHVVHVPVGNPNGVAREGVGVDSGHVVARENPTPRQAVLVNGPLPVVPGLWMNTLHSFASPFRPGTIFARVNRR